MLRSQEEVKFTPTWSSIDFDCSNEVRAIPPVLFASRQQLSAVHHAILQGDQCRIRCRSLEQTAASNWNSQPSPVDHITSLLSFSSGHICQKAGLASRRQYTFCWVSLVWHYSHFPIREIFVECVSPAFCPLAFCYSTIHWPCLLTMDHYWDCAGFQFWEMLWSYWRTHNWWDRRFRCVELVQYAPETCPVVDRCCVLSELCSSYLLCHTLYPRSQSCNNDLQLVSSSVLLRQGKLYQQLEQLKVCMLCCVCNTS